MIKENLTYEQEASQFAMELLMPKDFVITEMKKIPNFDFMNDRDVRKLADKFKVVPAVMSMRLGQLMRENLNPK